MTAFAWRPMLETDLPSVVEIAGAVHPGFFERAIVLGEKRALHPAGAWLCEVAGSPVGYLLSHPWRSGSLPALNRMLEAIPHDADTYYIHDLALLPDARGTGAAGAIVTSILEDTGYGSASLIAVNGSRGFWERHGFAVADTPHLMEKLLSYEPEARLMVKPLV